MTKQRRFTEEFEEEAVRLAVTSGRTQREIAEDLGVGLSTLVRWIGRSRDRDTGTVGRTPPDMAAEVKRLCREVAILRQERDILKRATAFFARSGQVDEVRARRSGEEGVPRTPPLPGARRQPEWLTATGLEPLS